ncbi:hypothetical protein BLNAU_21261 [Blattamonas nauphoetae]|uniref:Uncharacterized protein n=1 Tax=Blattamonas nauphoetae TaxID=2049346 RepID=A0ABQ9WWE7_9EUKA|nr:hypothetical protein BLNAU_21261 [Blattamonas nauphoetae]
METVITQIWSPKKAILLKSITVGSASRPRPVIRVCESGREMCCACCLTIHFSLRPNLVVDHVGLVHAEQLNPSSDANCLRYAEKQCSGCFRFEYQALAVKEAFLPQAQFACSQIRNPAGVVNKLVRLEELFFVRNAFFPLFHHNLLSSLSLPNIWGSIRRNVMVIS